MRTGPHVDWPGVDRADWPLTIAALARAAERPREEAFANFLSGLFPSFMPRSRVLDVPAAEPPSMVARRERDARLHAELSRPTPDLWHLRDLMDRGEGHIERLRDAERAPPPARPSPGAAMAAGYLVAMAVPVLCGIGIALDAAPLAFGPSMAWSAGALAYHLRRRTGHAGATEPRTALGA